MIIVTGGAGFIGSNIVRRLNQRGIDNILVVDNLSNGRKIHNLADLEIRDYIDREDFLTRIRADESLGKVEAIFHQGACSSTTEWDGRFMMRNNYEYSKYLLHWCQMQNVPFLYASSASVYGHGSKGFRETRACEHPINMYAYSKHLFDQYVRHQLSKGVGSQIVGLRYFNVYGPREGHKGRMASAALHFHQQLSEAGIARLFTGSDVYGDGEQRRDFVFVEDCADLNIWFYEHPEKSGIFNCGTGCSRTFNELAEAVIAWHGAGRIEYVPFPDHLKGAYQSFTQADTSSLRAIGCDQVFLTLEDGVRKYLDQNLQGKTPGAGGA